MNNPSVEQMQENAITHMEGSFSQDKIDHACECIIKAKGNILFTIQSLSCDAMLPPKLVAAIVM